MIFIDKVKNFKIYKSPLFLPTLERDKKKKSAILMMTPSYTSSKKILLHPMLINKLRFSSYYLDKDVYYYINSKDDKGKEKSITESANISSEELINAFSESVLNTGDKVIIFNEDAKNDAQLRKLLYNDRIKTRKEVLEMYDQVKQDFPFIKYTYPELDRYKQMNVFIDLYYYNSLFFANNTWVLKKGLNLYLDFVNRMINNPAIKNSGYTKKTVIIPVMDWNSTESVWNYKTSLNPMSVLYQMMYLDMKDRIKSVFGDTDIIFLAPRCYFKINFSTLEDPDFKRLSITFKNFLIKMVKGTDFDASEVDTTMDYPDKDVIRTNIIDKIEVSKGVDVTKDFYKVKDSKSLPIEPEFKVEKEKEDENKVISKGTLNKAQKEKSDKSPEYYRMLSIIDSVSGYARNEEDAWDELDKDWIKRILIELDSKDSSKVDVSHGRSVRMSKLSEDLLNASFKGRSIKELLEDKNDEGTKPMELELATPNESFNNLTFVNFDKDYNLDRDIVRCFRFFESVSRPIAIRNIESRDNSTSEDRVELYTVEMEDYRGKRFTVKLDIPIMKDNRFLLRGNNKSIQTQFFNMPILKTDENTCQVVSNYMKIIINRFGNGSGKSLPMTGRFIKACKKYTGNELKISFGDNTKVCSKYELPVDYIDISSVVNKIETKDCIYYFNQDEIRQLYEVEDYKGIPYGYNKKTKTVFYIENSSNFAFTQHLALSIKLASESFFELFEKATPSSISSYSRCSIMNSDIPLVIICAYHEGLRRTMDKARVGYKLTQKLDKYDKEYYKDHIKFKDGYLVFESSYESSMLLNGLKDCPTEEFSLSDIDNRDMYLEFLDQYGGRIKADGLDNFYDCMVDPLTKDILEFYKMPTDYVSMLLYANSLLADNKFIKHTDASSKRFRRYALIAVYTYKVLADAYASFANQTKHRRDAAEFMVKQSAVIDKFLTDSISSDDSCINALRDIETTNSVTTKGPSGMNSDRAYSLDKRTYDESMLNVLGMSTGFAANVGITRQATINANIAGKDGYVQSINGDTSKMNSANTLTATEALTPFGSTRDDPFRTAMTFVQTAKHMVRTENADPLLVTSGIDEAMPYLSTNKFAHKAKMNGEVVEYTGEYIIVKYEDGSKEYINLKETIEKNSDGGYYVPLKLDANEKIKVGYKFKENEILAYDKYSFSNSLGESDNLAYNIGKLAKVAVINTDEGFEDSGVITEKMAANLATRINLQYSIILGKDSNVFSIAEIGDHMEAGDSLLIWQEPFEEEDANSMLKLMSSGDISELGKRKLKSEVTGQIMDIKIYRTVELDEMSDSLRKIVADYEAPLQKLAKTLSGHELNTSEIPAHYKLDPIGKLKKARDSILIEFYVEYVDTVGVGDKIVYYSANKAVEKSVIPKGKEPYTDFRPREHIDAFVSEVSIDKRMVTSTIIYGALQKLMIELDRSVKDIMDIPYDDSQV